MDPNWKGLAWVGEIYQKFEELCVDVEEIIPQESYEYVQNQMHAVGANVKQFCSEFMQDVLYQSSVEEKAPDSSILPNIDSLACEKTMLNNSEDTELESGDESNWLCPSSMESVGEEHLSSSLGKNVVTEMVENSKAVVMEKYKMEKQSLSEMSEAGADVEISSSTASLSSSHHVCDSELSSEALISCPISIELTGCKSSVTADEIGINLADTFASISTAEPSSSDVMEVESHAYKVSDVGLAPLIGGLSAESIDEEADGDADASIKPGMETIQLFAESYILVGGNEHRSYKKKLKRALRKRSAKENECGQRAASLGELYARSKIHSRKSCRDCTHISDSDSSDHDFSESEWEIISPISSKI